MSPDEVAAQFGRLGRSVASLASRDSFHGPTHDYFFPCQMNGFGGGWAGNSAWPGITEREILVGLGFDPRRVDPRETRSIPPWMGITERGLRHLDGGADQDASPGHEDRRSSPAAMSPHHAWISGGGGVFPLITRTRLRGGSFRLPERVLPKQLLSARKYSIRLISAVRSKNKWYNLAVLFRVGTFEGWT
jgi:hypothetical protein